MANNWHQYRKWIFRMNRVLHSTWIGYHLIQYNLFFFIYLVAVLLSKWHCCAVATFSFLRGGGNWWLVGWIFWRPQNWHKQKLEGPQGPTSFCLCQFQFRTVHATENRSAQERTWTLLQMMVGFSYDKESANAVMLKDKEYEYASSAWNKQMIKSSPFFAGEMSAEKNVEQSCSVWQQAR